jgi:hypothetical protein
MSRTWWVLLNYLRSRKTERPDSGAMGNALEPVKKN